MRLSRRNFIAAATVGITTLIAWSVKFRLFKKKKPTAKFLTRDGTLVELEVDHLPFKRKKASKNQMMNWVHNQNT